jgi:hypothetical protein
MHVVEIRLKPSELSKQMAAMRIWLDEHRINLSTFSCRHKEDGMLVRVEFRRAHQAAPFAARFGGRANGPSAAYAEEDLMQEMASADALVG